MNPYLAGGRLPPIPQSKMHLHCSIRLSCGCRASLTIITNVSRGCMIATGTLCRQTKHFWAACTRLCALSGTYAFCSTPLMMVPAVINVWLSSNSCATCGHRQSRGRISVPLDDQLLRGLVCGTEICCLLLNDT